MQNRSYLYSTYGLNIYSEIRLPGLVEIVFEEGSRSDVNILFTKITESVVTEHLGNAPLIKAPGCDVRASERAMCFEYEHGATILVSGGNTVLVELKAGTSEESILPYLMGYVLAILLHQRNCLALHASVVAVNEKAVAFMGAKGYGKSTLAASLQVRGYRLISDDCLPIIFEADKILTLPGYPQIKLYADSVTAVGSNPSQLPPVYHNNSKYSYPCDEKFSNENLPLSAIYVLNVDDRISIEKLTLPQAFIEVTKHTHVNYYLKETNRRQEHFQDCHKLVHAVPFFQLNRPHDFEKMNEVTRSLERHMNGLAVSNEHWQTSIVQ